MTEQTASPHFNTAVELETAVGVEGSWSALSAFTVAGLAVATLGNALYYVGRYIGQENVPGDIKRLRRSVHEVMRRMGQPVIVKHMFNDHDYRLGIARPSPGAVDAYGQQVRNRDPFSYGSGYCSMQLSSDEWLNPQTGAIVTSSTSPGIGFIAAPFYRGYGPGFLTYLIEPDVALDLFKVGATGALIKTQSQTVVSGWFPEINDNDLVINVQLDAEGNVVDSFERYQAKRTMPITIRGQDRRGRRENSIDHGNRHAVNQQFEMNTVPTTSILHQVEIDR